MKRLILSLALVSTALFVSTVSAEKPEQGAKGKRAAAEGRPGGPQRDPAKMVARIMGEFDKDGDEKLDKTELTAWLKVMHERRVQGMRRGGQAGKGKPGAAGKRKRGGAEAESRPGGDLPVRPEGE